MRVFPEVVFFSLVRGMWGVESKVEQPWLAGWRAANEARCFGAQQIGGVALFGGGAIVVVPIALAFAVVGEVIDGAVVVAVKAREAMGEREEFTARLAKMPLVNDGAALITGAGEQFGQGVFV